MFTYSIISFLQLLKNPRATLRIPTHVYMYEEVRHREQPLIDMSSIAQPRVVIYGENFPTPFIQQIPIIS